MYKFNYIINDGSCSGYEEIKTNQMRKAKGIYSQSAKVRKSTTIPGVLPETQRQAEEWESDLVVKWEDFRCAQIGGCWQGKREAG